jgi:hypothetical protein
MESLVLPKTRDEAKACGNRLYYTCKPCNRGHLSARKVSNRACQACNAFNARNWAKENPEKLLAASRKFETTHRERLLVKRRETKRLRYAEDPEKQKIAAQKWAAKNQARKYELNARRRAANRLASPLWLTEQHRLEIEKVYLLAKSLSESTGFEHHVDHIFPLRGKRSCGLHVPWNLEVLPRNENIRKGNKEPSCDLALAFVPIEDGKWRA